MTKKPDVKPYNVWTDPTAPDQVFEHAEMMKRLKEVHGIDPATTKGKKQMVWHIDGTTWFDWRWDWEIGGKTFQQSTRTMRSGEDAAYWGHGE